MKVPSHITKVDGVSYEPDAIRELRDELIALRDSQFQHWPDSIDVTLVLTHTIALMAFLVELLESND